MKKQTKPATFLLIFSLLSVISIPAAAGGQQTAQSATVMPQSVTGNLLELSNTTDNRPDTRAHSGRKDYVGMSFTIDLGTDQNVIGVSQDHGRWPTHHPGAYRIEVARNENGPWMQAWEGEGVRGDSRARFPAIRARYIRVTATSNRTPYNDIWSIAELRAGVDPGQRPRQIPDRPNQNPPNQNPGPLPPPVRVRELANNRNAFDKRQDTYASSETSDYEGMVFNFDLGGEFELSRLVQVHGGRPEDFPYEYKIEVSRARDEDRFREVFRGTGTRNRSVATFNPVVTRYVRITALRRRDRTHQWSIAEIRTNRDGDVIDRDDEDGLLGREIRSITATGLANIGAVIDDNNTSGASTNTPNYIGSFINIDLGGSYSVSRVVQFHQPEPNEFAGRYKVDISDDGRRWQTVYEGAGTAGRSVAEFSPVRTRYLRITATDRRNNRSPWSIYKLKVKG